MINRAYYLPRWCSVANYVELASEFGLEGVKTNDWTKYADLTHSAYLEQEV